MTVHFIGAGPGAADLLTLRGQALLASSPVCLYAGSIIPAAMLVHCPTDARIVDTAALSLDDIIAECQAAAATGLDVARLQSGDLSLYSAVAEQTRRLRALGIAYTMTPGVPAFAAAASVLEQELTVPALAQTVVLTRVSGRASRMPPAESLAVYGATGATIVLHLAIQAIGRAVETLAPLYGADCPVAVVERASWPDQRVVRGTLADIAARLSHDPIERTAVIIVGRVLGAADFSESALYSDAYPRRFRPARAGGLAGGLA